MYHQKKLPGGWGWGWVGVQGAGNTRLGGTNAKPKLEVITKATWVRLTLSVDMRMAETTTNEDLKKVFSFILCKL